MGLEWIGINSKPQKNVTEVEQVFYSIAQAYVACAKFNRKLMLEWICENWMLRKV